MNDEAARQGRPDTSTFTAADDSTGSGGTRVPTFLRKLRTREHAVGWATPCPDVHSSDGFSVLIRADEKADRYRFECVEAADGDVCGHERDLIRLLGLDKDDVGLAAARATEWLLDAADLLARPDPGPTPWLVEDLIVDGALTAAVGKWKTTKSYALLEVCIAVATGRPAFGKLAIPKPGQVVFVNEESGEAALWRRLDSLCRGRAIDPEELRGRLHRCAEPQRQARRPGLD